MCKDVCLQLFAPPDLGAWGEQLVVELVAVVGKLTGSNVTVRCALRCVKVHCALRCVRVHCALRCVKVHCALLCVKFHCALRCVKVHYTELNCT